jgi:hypothetical protein
MADAIITSSGLAAAVGVKLLYDVCGPTAKQAGTELKSYAKIGTQNLRRVFEIAAKKLREQNKTEGQVPPRVLKEILSEAYFCEDELQALYGTQDSVQQTSAEWMQKLIKFIPNFRNRLAHGNPQLYLEASFRQLETCADLINQLFSLPATEKDTHFQ